MDPTATLAEMIGAIDARDYDHARECAGNLLIWLGRGGFAPTGCTPAETRTLCQKVLYHAESVTPADTCIGE
jgi:hypothetical protein